MRRVAAVFRASLRRLVGPARLVLFTGLGILAGWMAEVVEGLEEKEAWAGRVELTLATVSVMTAIVAFAAAAGASHRDRAIGHLDFIRLRPGGSGIWLAGTALSVVALTLVAWVLMSASALLTLSVSGGRQPFELIGPRRRIFPSELPGRPATVSRLSRQGLTFVFAGAELGSGLHEGLIPWRVLFSDPLRRGGVVGISVLLERGDVAVREPLSWRPRGDLRFAVPSSIIHARGDLAINLRLEAEGVDVQVDTRRVVLLGQRRSPWVTLGLAMLALAVAELPLLLGGLVSGLVLRLPLAMVLMGSWMIVGLGQPALEQMVRAEALAPGSRAVLRTGLQAVATPSAESSGGAIHLALAFATRAAPDLSALFRIRSAFMDAVPFRPGEAAGMNPGGGPAKTLPWDLVLVAVGLLLARKAGR